MTDVEETTGMNKEPLISSEVFDYLRNLAIEPYTKLSDIAREQLGDGVRLVSLFPGESFSTYKPGLRVTVLSGKVRFEPAGLELDLTSTRDRTFHTQDSENRLIAGENSVVLLADSEFLDTLSSWVELAAYAKQSGGDDLLKRLLAVKTYPRLQAPALGTRDAGAAADGAAQGQGGRGDRHPGRTRRCLLPDLVRPRRGLADRAFTTTSSNWSTAMGPGDAFGDEALVIRGTRNATVKMSRGWRTAGAGRTAFRDLMSLR
jgi:hypothetical protein